MVDVAYDDDVDMAHLRQIWTQERFYTFDSHWRAVLNGRQWSIFEGVISRNQGGVVLYVVFTREAVELNGCRVDSNSRRPLPIKWFIFFLIAGNVCRWISRIRSPDDYSRTATVLDIWMYFGDHVIMQGSSHRVVFDGNTSAALEFQRLYAMDRSLRCFLRH